MSISKSKARRLAIDAYEAGANVLRGQLTVEINGATVDGTDILEWLSQHNGSEVILIVSPVGAVPIESETKTCYTCGTDYTGETCPRCYEAQSRLRGWK